MVDMISETRDGDAYEQDVVRVSYSGDIFVTASDDN